MAEEMNLEKLKKEYPDFFKNFPSNLIKLALSGKTNSQIVEICFRGGIEDEKIIGEIAYYIASVLLGRLPLEILPKVIATNLKIDIKIANKISEEANHLIFSQVKDELAKLYGKGVPSKKTEEKPKRPPGKDTYREPVD